MLPSLRTISRVFCYFAIFPIFGWCYVPQVCWCVHGWLHATKSLANRYGVVTSWSPVFQEKYKESKLRLLFVCRTQDGYVRCCCNAIYAYSPRRVWWSRGYDSLSTLRSSSSLCSLHALVFCFVFAFVSACMSRASRRAPSTRRCTPWVWACWCCAAVASSCVQGAVLMSLW